MQNNLLKIEKCSAKLSVKKTDHGYSGVLYVGSVMINQKDESAFENIALSEYEGQKLDVVIMEKNLVYNGKIIASYENLFDNGVPALIGTYGPSSPNYGKACIAIKDENNKTVKLASVDLNELPKGLFDRRRKFPVVIYNDSSWTIVRYANLHQHTDASLLDGMINVKDLVKKTEWCAAVTDHGNMHAFNEFYRAMTKAEKKPIIGCEIYVETPGGTPRPVLNLSSAEDADDQMFDNEKSPKSTLAGEHMILLAENNTGLHNLFKLVTESSTHFYRKPHVTWEMLEKYHDGLIATSACIAGTLGRSIKEILKCEANPNHPNAVSVKEANKHIAELFMNEMIRIFGKDNFYIELQNHHFPLEAQIMDRIRIISDRYGVKRIVGIDAHYLNKEDAHVHEMWLCAQTKKKMSDPTRMKFSGDGYYVHSSDEVVDLFPDDLDALDNTLDIAERCNVDINSKGYHLPKFPLPKGFGTDRDYLHHLVREGFKKLWEEGKIGIPGRRQDYIERIKYELSVIEKMGWESYFLVVSDFIAYARDTEVSKHLEQYFPSEYYDHSAIPAYILKRNEVYVGTGRGSGAGSLVCCCLGITKVDPMKYDLLFERFLSPDRVSMPDIDTDFEDATREQVIEYCRFKYGADHVARIVTFGTAAAKNALKTITRVNGYPVALGNELANAVPAEPKMTLAKASAESPDFAAFSSDRIKESIISSAKKIEGLKTNRSIHACGVLIADKPITEYMPLVLMQNPQGEELVWTTQLQGPECEDMGLLKMDFLGLRTLGIAHQTINMIQRNHGIVIDYDEIPLDDLDVYTFLADGNTEAVFQAESDIFTKTMTGALADIADKDFSAYTEDRKKALAEKLFMRVSDCNALVRPGPNQYTAEYTSQITSEHPENIKLDDESMREQLESTAGIMLYQEQVMLLTRKMAGFSAGQADAIRKAMGKKKRDILDEYAEYFVTGSVEKNITGCVANGIPEDVARKVWSDMEKFAGYAFNKSHAVAYSMHTVRTAWLAKYYFPEYMCAVLNSFLNNADKIRSYIPVIRARNVALLPPSINDSEANFSTDGEVIRFGLSGLKGISAASELILNERDTRGLFSTYSEFIYRMARYQKLNRSILESLIKAGTMDSLDYSSRNAKLLSVEKAMDFASSSKAVSKDSFSIFDILDEISPDNHAGSSFLSFDYDRSIPEMPKKELLEYEDEVVGFYISGHPMDEYKDFLAEDRSIKTISSVIRDVEEMTPETAGNVTAETRKIAGIIKEIDKKFDKNNHPFWRMKLEDSTGIISMTYFNSSNANVTDLNEILQEGSLIEVQGRASDSGYGAEVKVEFIAPLSKYMNVRQASDLTLKVYAGAYNTTSAFPAMYSYKSYGKVITLPLLDYVRYTIFKFKGPEKGPDPSSKGGALIHLVAIDDLGNENTIDFGPYMVSLQQYVLLQRCLSASNVIPDLRVYNKEKASK